MMKTRVIPALLLKENGLVKTVKFGNNRYVGDPINTIRIFNEKEVDELFILDISATPVQREPNYRMIEDIAGEAFMPVAYGGGVNSMEAVRRIFSLGIEKIVLNNSLFEHPELLSSAVSEYGSQALVACLDCKRNLFGRYDLYTHGGKVKRDTGLDRHLQNLSEMGVGEILVNSIDRDGTQSGYDLPLLKYVSGRVTCPVVACGGAGKVEDFIAAVSEGQASAVAAGSMFVFKGKHRAVLINYPDRKTLTGFLP